MRSSERTCTAIRDGSGCQESWEKSFNLKSSDVFLVVSCNCSAIRRNSLAPSAATATTDNIHINYANELFAFYLGLAICNVFYCSRACTNCLQCVVTCVRCALFQCCLHRSAASFSVAKWQCTQWPHEYQFRVRSESSGTTTLIRNIL